MNDEPTTDPVVDLGRSRERLKLKRQERAEAELATRFHDAMGWRGASTDRSSKKKKPKRKKR